MPIKRQNWCNDSELYFGTRNVSRVSILHKAIATKICQSRAKKILDFGSGDGRFLHSLDEHNNFDITLFDPDRRAIDLASKEFGMHKHIRFTTNVLDLKDEAFDVAIVSNVLMLAESSQALQGMVDQISGVIKSNGTAYIGVTHPCFLDRKFVTFSNDYTLGNLDFDYFANGSEYRVYMGDHNQVEIHDYFWNQSTLIKAFNRAGLILADMDELKDIEENAFPPYLLMQFGGSNLRGEK